MRFTIFNQQQHQILGTKKDLLVLRIQVEENEYSKKSRRQETKCFFKIYIKLYKKTT